MSAQYLIRFDDICPTMNWSVWERVEEALLAARVKPILAIVPDNQHPALKAAASNQEFWEVVRRWQERGWTIGLHGYQHLLLTQSGGILKLNDWSEFSGLPLDEQRSRLQLALNIFRREKVEPEVWVAPGHSFDDTTLQVLNEIGIRQLSDGFSPYPYCDARGIIWVPQQLWRFRKMPFGVWTVCLHVNRWDSTDLKRFCSNLSEFQAGLTDWRAVVLRYQNRKRRLLDSVFSHIYPAALRLRSRLANRQTQNETPERPTSAYKSGKW